MKLPKGFLASGIRSGVRKKRPDLALIVAENGANGAAVFTTNRFQAAPVVLSRAALKKSAGRVKAVLINAGCANAITGQPGVDAAKRVREKTAGALGCPEDQILLASTGVIGVMLPERKIVDAIPDAIARLSASGVEAASHAILTTDIGPKVVQATFTHEGKRGRIVGLAKGAGMIHPNMATMLSFLMTDVDASPAFLQRVLKDCVDQTFNAITVDGDTSTNDTVLLLASGALKTSTLQTADDGADFRRALLEVCRQLAWMIVRDGEGASRVMQLEIRGARSEREAKIAAHAVATSSLVKTALNGGDPNWGRILAAIGRSGVRFSTRRISLTAGSVSLVVDGAPAKYREKDAAKVFAREVVPIIVDLKSGMATATLLASDLGHDYVSVNTDYRS